MLLAAASSSTGPPWQLYVSIAVLVVGVLTWLLGIATFVRVRARQTITQGPFFAIAVGPDVYSTGVDEYDAVGFSVTNHSLLHPVFLRRIGAEGRDPGGERVQVEAPLPGRQRLRLERGEGHPWEMTFGTLADGGIDIPKGVRGWAVIDGREKPYRSPLLQLHATGNRTMPTPSPRTRSR